MAGAGPGPFAHLWESDTGRLVRKIQGSVYDPIGLPSSMTAPNSWFYPPKASFGDIYGAVWSGPEVNRRNTHDRSGLRR